jgi:hypothetical protein
MADRREPAADDAVLMAGRLRRGLAVASPGLYQAPCRSRGGTR